jgi:sigma-B regulation protein RsbU (phosphoserine phosphatase)
VRRQAAAEVSAERLRLEHTLQQLPAGVILAEAPSGKVAMANRLAEEILGSPAGGPLPAERWPLIRAIRSEESTEEEDITHIAPSGRRVTLRVSAAPIRDEHGQTFAGVMVFQDVSERVRSEQMLTAQRDILAMVARGEPLERTLEAIADCAEELSEYGDARASIMLLSGDGLQLLPGAAPRLPAAYTEAIDGIAVGPSSGPFSAAAHRGETVTVADISADPLWADYRALAEDHGLRACTSSPIRATDGQLVGTLDVYFAHPRSPSAAEDRMIELLNRTAGVAIGRARDARARTRQLNELQRSLLPRSLPDIPGVGAAISFHPSDRGLDVGGDFYDVFALPDGSWGFVIGDVRGHGAEAAAVTALTRNTTRAIAALTFDPARVLEVVNSALRRSEFDRFCTAVFGLLELGAGSATVRLANAGHPPPLVLSPPGEVSELTTHGPLLGVFDAPSFPEVTVALAPGMTLLLHTDGLVERNPRVEREGGLTTLLAALAPRSDAAALVAELEERALGDPPGRLRDDVAVLALQVSGPGR